MIPQLLVCLVILAVCRYGWRVRHNHSKEEAPQPTTRSVRGWQKAAGRVSALAVQSQALTPLLRLAGIARYALELDEIHVGLLPRVYAGDVTVQLATPRGQTLSLAATCTSGACSGGAFLRLRGRVTLLAGRLDGHLVLSIVPAAAAPETLQLHLPARDLISLGQRTPGYFRADLAPTGHASQATRSAQAPDDTRVVPASRPYAAMRIRVLQGSVESAAPDAFVAASFGQATTGGFIDDAPVGMPRGIVDEEDAEEKEKGQEVEE